MNKRNRNGNGFILYKYMTENLVTSFRQPNVLAAPYGKTIKYLTCVTYSYTLQDREKKKERKY